MKVLGMLMKWSGDTQVLQVDQEELMPKVRRALGCQQIQLISLDNERVMLFDEEGKLKSHAVNATATMHARRSAAILDDDYIAGDAVIFPISAVQ